MWEILLGPFLILHGLIHVSYGMPRPKDNGKVHWPFDLSHSWVLSNLGCSPLQCRSIGNILWTLASLGFISAGMSLLSAGLVDTTWMPMAILSSFLSFLLLSLFWDRMLVLGLVIDAGLFVALAR